MTETADLSPTAPVAPPHARLRQAIVALPEDQRLVLTLFHFERLSLEEVAMVLDETEDEVAAQLYLAYQGAGMMERAGVAEAELQVA